MSNAAANAETKVRRLRPTDLEQVIAIDSHHFGEPRRAFFEKRLAQARAHPGDYVQVGIDRNGFLVGFAFACILRGEFGRERAIATLDAVGVMVSSREFSRCSRKPTGPTMPCCASSMPAALAWRRAWCSNGQP